MAQKIKVQDGIVVYSTADPSVDPIDFSILGALSVGNQPLADGIILSPPGTDIILAPGKNISLQTTAGSIVLNNVVWPDGTVTPTPGMYLGVSALNTLQFYLLPDGLTPINNI